MAVIILATTDNEKSIEFPVMDKCTIGRSSRCDLTLHDGQMSGRHGFLQFDQTGLFYTDLDSTNGSYINGARITKTQLKIGETLRIGNTNIIVDETKLTPEEKQVIGKSSPILSKKTAIKEKPKPRVVLNKDLKMKTWNRKENEKIFKADKSTGKTKKLELELELSPAQKRKKK